MNTAIFQKASLILVILLMGLVLCPLTAYAEDSGPSLTAGKALELTDDGGAAFPASSIKSSNNIAEGVCGECNWAIDSAGNLIISPSNGASGTLDNSNVTTGFPWYSYRSKIKTVEFADGVIAPTNVSHMFNGCSALVSVNWGNLDTSNVEDMSNMFLNCTSLSAVNLIGLDTRSVVIMNSMFQGCSNLDSIDLSSLNTAKCSDMSFMFCNCSDLVTASFAKSNTSSLTNMKGMFKGCKSLKTLVWRQLNTSRVTDMDSLFYGCSSLQSLNLSSFDTASVKDMGYMFYGCSSLSFVDLSSFDTASVKDMGYMFYGCSLLGSVDLSSFDTTSAENMSHMFYNCSNLRTLSILQFKTSNVQDISFMFYGTSNLSALVLPSDFDLSSVTNTSNMFYECSGLQSLDLSNKNLSSVLSMEQMFRRCKSLRIVNMEGCDISSATTLSNMFSQCENLASINLSNVNARSVTDISQMFFQCKSLENVDFSTFSTGQLKSVFSLFYECYALKHVDVSSLDTSSATSYSNMFSYCTNVETITTGLLYDTSKGFPGPTSDNGKWWSAALKDWVTSQEIANNRRFTNDVYSNIAREEFSSSTKIKVITSGTISTGSGEVLYDDLVYDGKEKKPRVTVTHRPSGSWTDKTLSTSDYDVFYENNVNAGTARVTIVGKGAYMGTRSASFTVKPRSIVVQPYDAVKTVGAEDPVFQIRTPCVYGLPNYPGLIGDDSISYTLTREPGEIAGKYTITASGDTLQGNYKINFVKATLCITAPISQANVSDIPDQVYSGTEITPDVVVSDGEKVLQQGVDYDLVYENNLNAGTATVTVVGCGVYTGSVDKHFVIARKPATVKANDASKGYGDEDCPLSATVEGVVDGSEIQYSITREAGEEIGSYRIVATGESVQGNYEIAYVDGFFSILPSIKDAAISNIPDQTYTGNAIIPSFTVSLSGEVLREGIDYEIIASSNIDVGTASVLVVGKGGYGSSVAQDFNIVPAPIADTAISSVTDCEYTGEAIEQHPTIVFNEKTLVENSDYTLSFDNNVNAGVAQLAICGKGNFEGEICIPFTINKADIRNAQVEGLTSQYYTGLQLTQDPVVRYGENQLVLDQDYYLEYEDNISPGKATMTIHGKGNFSGQASYDFDILPADLSSAVVLTPEPIVYTGNSETPLLTVMLDDRVLVPNSDYTVEYQNNVNVGKALAVVTGVGNYTGTVDVEFDIVAKFLSEAQIVLSSDSYIYDGTAKEPTATVMFGDTELEIGVDYEVEYENNIDAGEASVTATGMGNYAGQLSACFSIAKANSEFDASPIKPSLLYPFSVSDDQCDLTTNIAVSHASGTVTYENASVDSIAATFWVGLGTAFVTVPAGTPKGSYPLLITVTDSGDANHEAAIRTIGYSIEVVDITDITVAEGVMGDGLEWRIDGNYTLLISGDGRMPDYDPGSTPWAAYQEQIKRVKIDTGVVSVGDYAFSYCTSVVDVELPNGLCTIGERAFEGCSSLESLSLPDTVSYIGNYAFGGMKYGSRIACSESVANLIEPGMYTHEKTSIPYYSDGSMMDAFGGYDAERRTIHLEGKSLLKFETWAEGTSSWSLSMDGLVLAEGGSTGFAPGIYTEKLTLPAGDVDLLLEFDKPSSVRYCRYSVSRYLDDAEVSLSEHSFVYTGSAITPSIGSVQLDGAVLKQDIDYKLSYSNNVDVGDAEVSVVGLGGYTGTKTAIFKITPADVMTANANLNPTSCVYDGTIKQPDVMVEFGSKTLTCGVDYEVAYYDNVDAGTATVAIAGKGNYSGTKEITFTIDRATIDIPTVKTGLVYTGEELTGVEDGEGYSVEGGSAVDAGTYTARLTVDSNHQFPGGATTASVEWSIATPGGWNKIDGKWYYYDDGGNMVTSKWVKDSNGWVYLGADGVMVTEKWVKDSKGWCYVGEDGYAVHDQWKRDSKGWCYLDENCRLTIGWKKISPKWYYFDSAGRMVASKWMKDSKGWVYLDANGAMATNKWVKDSKGWCYVGSNGYAVHDQWKKDSKGWCYLDENCRLTIGWKQIKGTWYYFDANGRMVTGTQTIGPNTYKFADNGALIG